MDDGLRARLERREAIIAAVSRILVEGLHVRLPVDGIELDAELFGTGLGLDSLDAIELVVASEERFEVALPTNVLRARVRSVNTLTDLVIELQDASGRPTAFSEQDRRPDERARRVD
jgi:acyl carrier protein